MNVDIAEQPLAKRKACIPKSIEDRVHRIQQISAGVAKIVKQIDPVILMPTVYRLAREVAPGSSGDLQVVVVQLFENVLDDKVDIDDVTSTMQPRCGETYADIMFHLRMEFQQFKEGGVTITFTKILLNVVQDEFEALTGSSFSEEADDKVLHKSIALCSFIGHLHVRKLLAARIMAQVVHDLIGVSNRQPGEHFIRCACELLLVIGKSIDSSKEGNMLMTQFLARLSILAGSKQPDTDKAFYPQQVRNVIKSVHEARFHEWPIRTGSSMYMKLEVIGPDDVPALKERLQHVLLRSCTVEELVDGFGELESATHVQGHAKGAVASRKRRNDSMEGVEEIVGQPLRVTTFVSGRECAIVEGFSLDDLPEIPVKEAIAAWTGVHPKRMVVLMPDGVTVLRGQAG